MSSKTTETELIETLADYQLENGYKKISVVDLVGSVGISRTAFYNYYCHLKEYLNGEMLVFSLLSDSTKNKYLLKSIEKNQHLKEMIATERKNALADHSKIESRFITTLMNSDISALNAKDINADREKQAIHNSRLVQKVKKLEDELSELKFNNTNNIKVKTPYDNEVVILPINLSSALKKYKSKNDYDVFDDEKEAAIEALIKKVNKLNSIQSNKVDIFLDRYFSSFEKYCKNYINDTKNTVVIIQLPIFTKLELQNVVSQLSNYESISLYFPYSDSEAVVKAQRAFQFKGIPTEEFNAADRSSTPNSSYRLDTVIIQKIRQGD